LVSLVDASDFKGALDEAIKIGDEAYELGKVDEAINVFENLLDVYKSHSMNNATLLVKVYEKLSPLYFEVNNTKKGIDATLAVVENKLALNETSEAIQILKILEVQFLSNSALMKKIIEIYIKIGFLSNALKLVDRIIQSQSKPDAEILRIGGEIALKLGRLQDALSYFNAVLIVDAKDEKTRAKIAEINQNINSGNQAKAQKVVGESIVNKETPVDKVAPPLEEESKGEKQPQFLDLMHNQEVKGAPAGGTEAKIETAENTSQTRSLQAAASRSEFSFTKNPLYLQALEEIKTGELEQGIKILIGLAKTFETGDIISAEFLYDKILLLDPTNIKILLSLAEIQKSNNNQSDAIFYLRVAVRNSSGEEKLSLLKELLLLLPNDTGLMSETFEAYTQLGKIDGAIALLEKAPKRELLESFAIKLIPYVKDDSASLVKVAHILKKNNISGDVYYQYAYLAYKSLFSQGEQIEAIKWFISAHRLNKLPLEDYIEVANYIKNIPLDDEKSIVAEAIFGYLDAVDDVNKKSYLVGLLMDLKPEKPNYIAKQLAILLESHNYKDAPKAVLKLVGYNSFDYAPLLYDASRQLKDELDTQSTLKIAQFFELAGKKDEASSLYQAVLIKDPKNEIALVKGFIGKVESELVLDLLTIMDSMSPSHSYEEFLMPTTEKYKNEQARNPFDYHSHFVLGFIYFFTERYEEAIASFQFVVRSHHYESFMHLLLGIAFEKILLEDFALKQYEVGLVLEKETTPTRLALLYRAALLKKMVGALADSRKYLEEIVAASPDYKNARELLEGFETVNKIIGINKEETK
jgi:predicted Zn-dependent protease